MLLLPVQSQPSVQGCNVPILLSNKLQSLVPETTVSLSSFLHIPYNHINQSCVIVEMIFALFVVCFLLSWDESKVTGSSIGIRPFGELCVAHYMFISVHQTHHGVPPEENERFTELWQMLNFNQRGLDIQHAKVLHLRRTNLAHVVSVRQTHQNGVQGLM